MTSGSPPPRIQERVDDPFGIIDLKALVAHRSRHVAQIIHGILISHGANRVDEVEEERAFRAVVADRAYDVIFIDDGFPKNHVFDFVTKFRRSAAHGNHRTPVVVMMAVPTGADVLAARDAGVNELIVKPFSSLTLSRHLGRALRPRKFVESGAYIGPDRRQRDLPPPRGVDRRGRAE